MKQVDILYSQTLSSVLREALKDAHKGVRIEELPGRELTMIYIDKKYTDREPTFAMLANACAALKGVDADLFCVTHTVSPFYPVVVTYPNFELFFQYSDKEHYEHFSYGDGQKRELFISYRKAGTKLGNLCGITDIWMFGPHTHVRQVKRFIANHMSNGNNKLDATTLDRIVQLAGNSVRVYMKTNIDILIDVVSGTIVEPGGFPRGNVDCFIENSRVVITGKRIAHFHTATKWDYLVTAASN